VAIPDLDENAVEVEANEGASASSTTTSSSVLALV
jgi:hypothetical protein